MNLATGCAFRIKDLFLNFPFNKLKFDGGTFKEIFKNKHRTEILARILTYCIELVIKDIIENNVTFIFPTGKKYAALHMYRTTPKGFQQLRQCGSDMDVDFLETNFTTYKLRFTWMGANFMRSKHVNIGGEYKDMLIENINKGIKYC